MKVTSMPYSSTIPYPLDINTTPFHLARSIGFLYGYATFLVGTVEI